MAKNRLFWGIFLSFLISPSWTIENIPSDATKPLSQDMDNLWTEIARKERHLSQLSGLAEEEGYEIPAPDIANYEDSELGLKRYSRALDLTIRDLEEFFFGWRSVDPDDEALWIDRVAEGDKKTGR